MAQIIDPLELRTQQINTGNAPGDAAPETAKPATQKPRSPAPPKRRRGNDFSLAKQPAGVMNSASAAPKSLTADGYWIIRRLIRGEHVTQENSGLAPTEWRDLMQQLGRNAQPA